MDPRAAAIILSSLVETILELAISSKMVRLNERNFESMFRGGTAPLSSLSAKIAMAFALGLVGAELRSQLDRFRSIRNVFAHAMVRVTFDHPEIVEECLKLDPQKIIEGRYEPATDSPRERFTMVGWITVTLLLRNLQHRREEGRYGWMPWRQPSIQKLGQRHLQEIRTQD
jgi:hypothetical protein